MKLIKNILLVIPTMSLLLSLRPLDDSKNKGAHNRRFATSHVVLQYVGSMSGMINLSIGVTIYIDTTIGIRYEVVYEQGTRVLAHTALFYKFSNPYQWVFYDFRSHESKVKSGSPSGSDAKVDVLGNEIEDSFACTHLRHSVDKAVSDYWMSRDVPGFSQIVNTLKTVNTNLPGMAFNSTIFNWGGLVRMTNHFEDPKTGKTMDAELNLQEANTNVSLPAKTFDVPTN
jgi:hypothetical protein